MLKKSKKANRILRSVYGKKILCFLLILVIISFSGSSSFAIENDAGVTLQYRYRQKQYVTSNVKLSDPYILYDQKSTIVHGETFSLYLEEDKMVDTSIYCMHRKVSACKYHHQTNSRTKWVLTSSANHDYYYDYDTNGNLWWHYADGYCYTVCNLSSVTTDITYYYYFWDEWSEWSDTVYSADDNTQVEIRKIYTISYDANGGDSSPTSQKKNPR